MADYPYRSLGSYRAWPGPNSKHLRRPRGRAHPRQRRAAAADRARQGLDAPGPLCRAHPERHRPAPVLARLCRPDAGLGGRVRDQPARRGWRASTGAARP
ncbi:MAG: hypothetical protein PGN25_01585 [Methylorubrum populi]